MKKIQIDKILMKKENKDKVLPLNQIISGDTIRRLKKQKKLNLKIFKYNDKI